MEHFTYEVGLNIGIEMIREDIPVKKKSYWFCILFVLLAIDLYFLWNETMYVEN